MKLSNDEILQDLNIILSQVSKATIPVSHRDSKFSQKQLLDMAVKNIMGLKNKLEA